MAMPFRRARVRAVRPTPETLEDRKLLAKMVSGLDADGDMWTLKLTGPGDLRVTKMPDASGNPTSLNALSDIATIEVAGPDPVTTRLDGTVTKGPAGDGKVFFNDFEEIGGKSLHFGAATGNGINTVNMPGFWLANTNPPGTTNSLPTQINIPDGVITFRFGGADATVGIPAGSTTANTLALNFGLPQTIGTSIIADQFISGGRPNSTTPSSPLQDSITVTVDGRLDLFQANQILGNAAFPITGFFASGFSPGGGGTVVVSQVDPTSQVTGQIGYVNIGGDATNFSVQTNDKVSNFYVGGETNNVFLLSPGGSRNVYFGKGMDNVTINTHTLENLNANRGADGSKVSVERAAGRVLIGGDVTDTTVRSGYQLHLTQEFQNQTAPTATPAQGDGGMTVLVAGDIKDSVFAASVEPQSGQFGTNDLKLPLGHIAAKFEGTINNAAVTPSAPFTAFFAQHVQLKHGNIIPPIVPEAPFPPQMFHRGQAGLKARNPLLEEERHAAAAAAKKTAATTPKSTAETVDAARAAAAAARAAAATAHITSAVPQGPSSGKGKTKKA
jgi:hypothetical protein